MSNKPSFFAELQRRNVYKVGAMYAVSGWLLVQIVTQVFPIFDVTALVQRIIVLTIVAGFPVALALSWIYDLTPQGIVRTDPGAPDPAVRHAADQRLNRAIIAALSIAVLVLLARLFWPLSPVSAAPATQDKSIAVLPLANESGDSDQQYFSDGLSEDFINALSQVPGLRVISRNSSFQFRNSKDDSKSIGTRLGVAHLLEGSVRRSGDTVRISAELVNVADGSTLWSQHYDRPYADLFKLQDEVTADVAAALKSRLGGEMAAGIQSERPASGNLDAYKAYLQGQYHAARNNTDDELRAVDYFKEALRQDPRYGQAYAALCRSLAFLAGNYWQGTQSSQGYDQAHAACTSALSISPGLAVSHVANSWLLMTRDFDWPASEAEARQALQLAPGDPNALAQLGTVQKALGQSDQALAALQQALAADPLNALAYLRYAEDLLALGRLDEAQRAVTKAIELNPAAGINYYDAVLIDLLRGNAQAANEDAKRTPAGEYEELTQAFAAAAGADKAAADQQLQKLIDRDAEDDAYQIAQLYALRQQNDEAFAWLERSYANRDPGLIRLLTDPIFHSLRQEPRFAAFCAKSALPAPTVRSGGVR